MLHKVNVNVKWHHGHGTAVDACDEEGSSPSAYNLQPTRAHAGSLEKV